MGGGPDCGDTFLSSWAENYCESHKKGARAGARLVHHGYTACLSSPAMSAPMPSLSLQGQGLLPGQIILKTCYPPWHPALYLLSSPHPARPWTLEQMSHKSIHILQGSNAAYIQGAPQSLPGSPRRKLEIAWLMSVLLQLGNSQSVHMTINWTHLSCSHRLATDC